LIEKHQVSALPVLDNNGKVIGNFSASDLKKFISDEWMSFSWTVGDYIKKYSSFQSKTIKSNELFSNLIKNFAEGVEGHRYHRFWIVDDEGKPTSTVTMTDVMRMIRDIPTDE